MPPGPNDNPQQPVGSNGFPGSHLYPNKNIWTSSLSNARERSMGAKDADESPSGSSALNVNSEADVWGSNPWNTNDNPPRSVSTSPNRARDVPLSTGSAFFDHPPAAIGMKKSAFGDMYQTHTPSNSIQSQRPLSNQHSGFPPQSANQRAFNYNNKIDDDVAYQFNRRAVLDGNPTGPNSTLPFNPASQPFQFNPGSQPWMGDGGATRLGNGVDFGTDSLTSQFAAMKRPSVDRISPAPGYRLDNSTSPRTYAQSPDMWMNRPSSRDPRAEIERRGSAQYPQSFTPSYYGGGYPYGGLTSQFAPNFMDQYGHGFRHQMVPGYGLPSVSSGYPIGSNMSSPRPSRDQDPGKGMRSALLDEFRLSNKSSKRYELKDIYNYVVEFSGDQHGSRFIQQKLETANSDEKEQVFREIEPNAVQLMKDVFGNYVVQKFFEHGNQVQKKVLAEKMRGKVVDLSVQVYACRVVQKALEHVLVEQQAELTKELEPEIIRVIRDQNGNHVVQKIVELVPREYIDFIMNALRGQVTALASHTYGCRVIQRMLEYGTEADKLDIMNELHSSAQILITDQYGNYVAQHVIQNGKPKDRETLIQLVMAQLLTLSKHKFASNVVEKCIEHGTAEQRTRIREQLTMVGSDGTSPLQQMMRDQYGNYVIQKLLGQLQGSERDALVEDIKPQFFVLKKNGASRQLQALEKLLGVGNGAAGLTRNETPTSGDINSTSPTPVLTNETNSPQSSSPPSTYVSAVGMPTTEETKKTTANGVNSAGPQVQVEDA